MFIVRGNITGHVIVSVNGSRHVMINIITAYSTSYGPGFQLEKCYGQRKTAAGMFWSQGDEQLICYGKDLQQGVTNMLISSILADQ